MFDGCHSGIRIIIIHQTFRRVRGIAPGIGIDHLRHPVIGYRIKDLYIFQPGLLQDLHPFSPAVEPSLPWKGRIFCRITVDAQIGKPRIFFSAAAEVFQSVPVLPSQKKDPAGTQQFFQFMYGRNRIILLLQDFQTDNIIISPFRRKISFPAVRFRYEFCIRKRFRQRQGGHGPDPPAEQVRKVRIRGADLQKRRIPAELIPVQDRFPEIRLSYIFFPAYHFRHLTSPHPLRTQAVFEDGLPSERQD